MVAHLTHFCATCDAGRRRHGDAEGKAKAFFDRIYMINRI